MWNGPTNKLERHVTRPHRPEVNKQRSPGEHRPQKTTPDGRYLTIFPTSQFTLRFCLSTKRQSTKFTFRSVLDAGIARKALATSWVSTWVEPRYSTCLEKRFVLSWTLRIDIGNLTDILPIPYWQLVSFSNSVTRISTISTCTSCYWLLDACSVSRSWVWQLALRLY